MRLASTWFCTARRRELSLEIKFAVEVTTEGVDNVGMDGLHKR